MEKLHTAGLNEATRRTQRSYESEKGEMAGGQAAGRSTQIEIIA